MEVVLIIVVLLAVLGLVLLIGRALGDPKKQLKFDETPADVIRLDDGTTLNSEEWDINIPRKMTPEEQSQAAKDFERLRVRIEAERP